MNYKVKYVEQKPTYNEADNVETIVSGIFRPSDKVSFHQLNVLIVDDNSPDGTQTIAKRLIEKNSNLYMITGQKKA